MQDSACISYDCCQSWHSTTSAAGIRRLLAGDPPACMSISGVVNSSFNTSFSSEQLQRERERETSSLHLHRAALANQRFWPVFSHTLAISNRYLPFPITYKLCSVIFWNNTAAEIIKVITTLCQNAVLRSKFGIVVDHRMIDFDVLSEFRL